jgi:glutaminyl-peptide cyclotransferase
MIPLLPCSVSTPLTGGLNVKLGKHVCVYTVPKRFRWATQMTLRCLPLALVLVLFVSACRSEPGANPSTATNSNRAGVVRYTYEVVNTFPHDRNAFTQGLEFQDGKLLESTGEEGHSSLRRVVLETGQIEQKVDVPHPYFAEGITLLNGKIYQLTWQHQIGFIYDANTFEKKGEFKYEGEAWGLTNDGTSLIMSDGTNRLKFLDPDNFSVKRVIVVMAGKVPIDSLNELEYVQGQIYANIWHDNRMAIIDPQTGRVTGAVDLTGLLRPGEVSDEEAVLNGIAYDATSQRLFVTGKLWPKLFELRLKQ